MSFAREYIPQVGFGYKLKLDEYDLIGHCNSDSYIKSKLKNYWNEEYKVLIDGDTYDIEDLSEGYSLRYFECYICIEEYRLPFSGSFSESELFKLSNLKKSLEHSEIDFEPTPQHVQGVWIR